MNLYFWGLHRLIVCPQEAPVTMLIPWDVAIHKDLTTGVMSSDMLHAWSAALMEVR